MLGFLLVGVERVGLDAAGQRHADERTDAFHSRVELGNARILRQIAFALSGMEAIGLMAAEIRQPRRTVVPATWIGTVFTTVFYAASTLALLVLIRPNSISELHGLADGSDIAAGLLGLRWLTPLIAVIVLVNSIGGWGGLGSAVSRCLTPQASIICCRRLSRACIPSGRRLIYRYWYSAGSRRCCCSRCSWVTPCARHIKPCSHSWCCPGSSLISICSPARGRPAGTGRRIRHRHDGANYRFECCADGRGPKLWLFEGKLPGGNRADDRYRMVSLPSPEAITA